MDGSNLPAEAVSFQPTIVDETSPPEHDAEGSAAAVGGGKDNNNKKGKKFERKEQVPIEELYDLSKPIKRVSSNLSDYISLFGTGNFSMAHLCLGLLYFRLNAHQRKATRPKSPQLKPISNLFARNASHSRIKSMLPSGGTSSRRIPLWAANATPSTSSKTARVSWSNRSVIFAPVSRISRPTRIVSTTRRRMLVVE